MKRYRHPVYRGDVERFLAGCQERQKGDVYMADGENPFCGDSLRIAYCLRDGRIREICYDGYACSLCVASAECTLELVKGRSREEALGLTAERILAALGGLRVGKSRMKCVELALDVLRRSLETQKITGMSL